MAGMLLANPAEAQAQTEPRCAVLCAPALKVESTWTVESLGGAGLRPDNGLRNVEVELSLDYLATELPKAGDVVAGGRFIDAANPWSLSFVLVMPLAPLVP